MKKYLCLAMLAGTLAVGVLTARASETTAAFNAAEDSAAVYGGGAVADADPVSLNVNEAHAPTMRAAAGGGDFNCGVSGFKVYANYYHARAKHSATAKNGRGGQVRAVQKAGVRAYATCAATLSGNTGWWNVY